MKFLPFEKFTYRTDLDYNEVHHRLYDNIEPYQLIRFSSLFRNHSGKPYQGNLSNSSFDISRVIQYKNSFLPKIKGELKEDGKGTKIEVRMRLHLFAFIFMIVWFSGVTIACFFVGGLFFNNSSFEPFSLIPFAMLIFGYLLVVGAFKYESIKSKKYFAHLLEAEIEKS